MNQISMQHAQREHMNTRRDDELCSVAQNRACNTYRKDVVVEVQCFFPGKWTCTAAAACKRPATRCRRSLCRMSTHHRFRFIGQRTVNCRRQMRMIMIEWLPWWIWFGHHAAVCVTKQHTWKSMRSTLRSMHSH